jgi:hypothetical protein
MPLKADNSKFWMGERTSFDAGQYDIRNTPHPLSPKGRAPREGGKFQPRLYHSTESVSCMLTPSEYEQIYGAASESASFIDSTRPVQGFRLRRDYSRHRPGRPDDESIDKGIEVLIVLIIVDSGCGCIIL